MFSESLPRQLKKTREENPLNCPQDHVDDKAAVP